MASYLAELERDLTRRGCRAPLFLMLSGGGVCGVETAMRFPIRLVESGPAGGAVFAASIAAAHGLEKVLSFDMGGTTAKICLIDGAAPQLGRSFEVARVYRFLKGSGLPLRIPVVEMVEVGAGGGSVAGVDPLGRIQVGPAERRVRSGSGLLRARRCGADRDRRRPAARPDRWREFFRRQDPSRRLAGP